MDGKGVKSVSSGVSKSSAIHSSPCIFPGAAIRGLGVRRPLVAQLTSRPKRGKPVLIFQVVSGEHIYPGARSASLDFVECALNMIRESRK